MDLALITYNDWCTIKPNQTKLIPGPLWPGVVAFGRVQSIRQIEQTVCANKWLMLNCDCYIAVPETI